MAISRILAFTGEKDARPRLSDGARAGVSRSRAAGRREIGTQGGGSATILVVDDDAAIRRVFVAALHRAGYAAHEAADGAVALQVLADHRIDLILLDMDMPGVSGIELADRVRADSRHDSMGIMFVSGDGTLDSKLAGLQAGGNDYLVKPVALEELLARVSAQLRDRSLWLARLDEQLAARSQLARRIADVDPALPLALLERHLLGILGADLHLTSLTLTPAPANEAELSITAVGASTEVHVPLRYAGAVVGALTAVTDGPPDQVVSTLSDLSSQLGALIADGTARQGSVETARRWVDSLVLTGGLSAVYQPIVSLQDGTVIGYEGLSRFADGTAPDVAFARAAAAGVGPDLEVAAIRRLLADATALPDHRWLSLNVSAATLLRGTVVGELCGTERPLVLEVTENEHVDDYTAVRDCLARMTGVELAVDDAGAGYASLRHIFELRPDYIKLDRGWITDIDADPVRQALVHGMLGFSGAIGARTVAEGVERRAEADVLATLGVPLAQGYLFGRPSSAGAVP